MLETDLAVPALPIGAAPLHNALLPLLLCLAARVGAAEAPAEPGKLPVGKVHQVVCDEEGEVSYH